MTMMFSLHNGRVQIVQCCPAREEFRGRPSAVRPRTKSLLNVRTPESAIGPPDSASALKSTLGLRASAQNVSMVALATECVPRTKIWLNSMHVKCRRAST